MDSQYDTSVHEYGYCGHICDDPGGPFDTYVCFLERGHDDNIHQAVQVYDPSLAGLVNGAWTEDSKPLPELVTLDPEALASCPIRHMSPETAEQVNNRVDAISESVQMLVWEYQMRTTDSAAFNILEFTLSLVKGCRERYPNPEEALAMACEQLAVAIQKLAA
jgi:hypothetical protein